MGSYVALLQFPNYESQDSGVHSPSQWWARQTHGNCNAWSPGPTIRTK